MLCRALLTIFAILYLICVLLLSGLQKEDLDVNMLKKLQRHNVNIDDMNNESIRQECLSKSTLRKPESAIDITTEETKGEKKPQNKSIKGSSKDQLQTIVQYFIDLKNSDQQTDLALIEEPTKNLTIYENHSTFQISGIKSNLDATVKYEPPNRKKSYADIESIGGLEKPNLQKIIKLWNMYNKAYPEDNVKTEKVTLKIVQLEKYTSRPNVLKPRDNELGSKMEYMSQLITDYISKNKIIPTTLPPPSKTNIDVDAISRQIERHLAINDNEKLRNIDENIPLKLHNLFSNYMQTEPNVKILQKNNIEVNNPLKESLKNKAKKYLNEILWRNEQLQLNKLVLQYVQSFTQQPYLFSQNELSLGVNKPYESYNNNNVTKKINYSNEQVDKINNNKDIKIPADMIKEIAESVKAMVLKDLQKDTFPVTPTMTTKETSERESTTSKQEKLQDTNNVMEKFMELYQQFKTIKEKTVISSDAKFKTTEQKSVKNVYNGPFKQRYPPPMTPINPYGLIMPMAQMTPIFPNPYDPNSNANTPLVHDSNNNNLKNVHKITQVNIFHPKNEPQPAPLTIQTNSYEIPPLGIPISKPMKMENQNIVVTTKNPFMRPKIDRQHGNIIHHDLVYNNNRNANDWPNTYSMSNQERTHGDINRYKFKESNRDTRFKTKSRERPIYNSVSNDNTQYRSGHYKPHFSDSDYDRMRLRNQDITKFHERLERTEDSNIMDDREDCCKVKVASRQQLPISNINNRSRYDDTHFRNFLKTQQKVNDMLERILATKPKSDGPRSVETP